MATPAYPRNHSFPIKDKSTQHGSTARKKWNYVRCANPQCGWVYKVSPTSFESSMFESVAYLVNARGDRAPPVRYFCPSTDSVPTRLDGIKKSLLGLSCKNPDRLPEVRARIEKVEKLAHHMSRQYSDRSCREKYIDHQLKMAQAEALLEKRSKFAEVHDVQSEKDYPEDMRIDQNPELADMVKLHSAFEALGGDGADGDDEGTE